MLRSAPRSLALLLLLLPLSGCAKDASAGVEPAPAPVHVEVAKAELAQVPRTVRLTGSLKGEVETNLAAGANGRVIDVRVDVGAKVKKGDVLVKLDTNAVGLVASEAATQAELAKARQASATRECERAQKLFDSGAISKQELDRQTDQCRTSKLDVAAAELRAGQAQKSVIDGIIRAPLDGVVSQRFVELGEYVRADSNVVRVVTSDRLRLVVEAHEAVAPLLIVGSEVSFSVTAYPGRAWKTAVDRSGVSVRSASRDVVVEAPIANADLALLPGMFGMVEVTVGSEPLPAVPARAVRTTSGKSRLFVVERGHATERVVALGPVVSGDRVTVRKGLAEAEQVVVAPPEELKNGQAVE